MSDAKPPLPRAPANPISSWESRATCGLSLIADVWLLVAATALTGVVLASSRLDFGHVKSRTWNDTSGIGGGWSEIEEQVRRFDERTKAQSDL